MVKNKCLTIPSSNFLSSETVFPFYGIDEYLTLTYQNRRRPKRGDKVFDHERRRIWVIDHIQTEKYDNEPTVHTLNCKPLFPFIKPWATEVYYKPEEDEDW